ncbi:MAG TPA: endonuclease III [Candidatus Deferrimicrobium sp.]|nr:endonuclease III [Candidatus Deferrimicrobium sp.]
MNVPSDSLEDVRKRVRAILTLLKKQYPHAKCSLRFKSVHQLMVATILSAQCTDERVNRVTESLFKKYHSIRSFANADLNELGQDIFATGFHNNKAKAIKSSAQQLLERHGGKMPRTLDELVQLQGVGRKTASVILGAGFGLAEVVVVDTHVGRISHRLGFTRHSDPTKIERDLIQIIAREDWIVYAYLLIDHGRAVCKARRPECPCCPLLRLCPWPKQ